MKNLISQISLVLFFGIIALNAFGQTSNQKAAGSGSTVSDTTKKTVKDITDTGEKSGKPATTDAPKKPDTSGMSQFRGKSYVFQKAIRIVECNEVGEIIKNAIQPIAPKGITFTVQGTTKNGDLIISFWIWSLKKPVQENVNSLKQVVFTAKSIDSLNDEKKEEGAFKQRDILIKRETFNFKAYSYKQYVPSSIDSVNDNRRYFLLGKDILTNYCAEYKEVKKWQINYGTLVTTFKLRFNKFSFSNNLSVGGAVYYQRKKDSVWSWGGIGALSLSSVTLDAASTNLHTTPLLTTSTTRPAFSPSIHGVLTYKNINFTLGVGWDILSKPTDIATATNPEAGWIYNGKPWLGIGLGFNLFNNSATKATANTPGQTPGQ